MMPHPNKSVYNEDVVDEIPKINPNDMSLSHNCHHQLLEMAEENGALKKTNSMLQYWCKAAVVAFVSLSVALVVTSVATMRVADSCGTSDRVASGPHVFVLDYPSGTDGAEPTICMSAAEMADMWSSIVMEMTPTDAVLRTLPSSTTDDDESVGAALAVSFTPSNSFFNDTHACFKSVDGEHDLCTAYEPCTSSQNVDEEYEEDESPSNRKRRLTQQKRKNRRLFIQELKERATPGDKRSLEVEGACDTDGQRHVIAGIIQEMVPDGTVTASCVSSSSMEFKVTSDSQDELSNYNSRN